jgi:hypothetical protein
MTGIQCRSGHVFIMINDNYKDAEWRLQEYYYKAQGCEVITDKNLRFSNSEILCHHCNSLEHEFEILIEEIKES